MELLFGLVFTAAVFAAGIFTGLIYTGGVIGRKIRSELVAGRLTEEQAGRLADVRDAK